MREIQRSEGPHELRLDLPAAHSAGRMARQMVRQFAAAEGVPEREVQTLEFVAGELLDNAVDHGGGNGAREVSDLTSDVRMSLELDVLGDGWSVRVDDQGGGAPEEVLVFLDPRRPAPLDDERGRGFYILAKMVDAIDVRRTEDGRGLTIRAERRYGEPD